MKELITMAISKAVSPQSKVAKNARAALEPGRHGVNELVRLTGELVVHEDGDRASTASLMSPDFLMLVLHRCGVTRESAMSVISEVATEYLKDWTGSKEDKKAAKAARKAALEEYDPSGKGQAVFDEWKARIPRTPTKGAVKFEGTIEVVKVTKQQQPVLEVVEDIA